MPRQRQDVAAGGLSRAVLARGKRVAEARVRPWVLGVALSDNRDGLIVWRYDFKDRMQSRVCRVEGEE